MKRFKIEEVSECEVINSTNTMNYKLIAFVFLRL